MLKALLEENVLCTPLRKFCQNLFCENEQEFHKEDQDNYEGMVQDIHNDISSKSGKIYNNFTKHILQEKNQENKFENSKNEQNEWRAELIKPVGGRSNKNRGYCKKYNEASNQINQMDGGNGTPFRERNKKETIVSTTFTGQGDQESIGYFIYIPLPQVRKSNNEFKPSIVLEPPQNLISCTSYDKIPETQNHILHSTSRSIKDIPRELSDTSLTEDIKTEIINSVKSSYSTSPVSLTKLKNNQKTLRLETIEEEVSPNVSQHSSSSIHQLMAVVETQDTYSSGSESTSRLSLSVLSIVSQKSENINELKKDSDSCELTLYVESNNDFTVEEVDKSDHTDDTLYAVNSINEPNNLINKQYLMDIFVRSDLSLSSDDAKFNSEKSISFNESQEGKIMNHQFQSNVYLSQGSNADNGSKEENSNVNFPIESDTISSTKTKQQTIDIKAKVSDSTSSQDSETQLSCSSELLTDSKQSRLKLNIGEHDQMSKEELCIHSIRSLSDSAISLNSLFNLDSLRSNSDSSVASESNQTRRQGIKKTNLEDSKITLPHQEINKSNPFELMEKQDIQAGYTLGYSPDSKLTGFVFDTPQELTKSLPRLSERKRVLGVGLTKTVPELRQSMKSIQSKTIKSLRAIRSFLSWISRPKKKRGVATVSKSPEPELDISEKTTIPTSMREKRQESCLSILIPPDL